MGKWVTFPQSGEFKYTTTTLKKHWDRLHAGDCEPLPSSPEALAAWVLFHNGAFEAAAEAGRLAGDAGIAVACKATAIYANYLEEHEKTRLDLFKQVAERAHALALQHPDNANAWYWHAYALGRYSQGINVAKALAQGLGNKVKESLEKTIALAPGHVDARIALGVFHAEVIDKVGALIGGMTYGVKKDKGLQLFQEALRLQPDSAIARIEYANALIMLEGAQKMPESTRLYEQAAASAPLDARERLDVEMARAGLQD